MKLILPLLLLFSINLAITAQEEHDAYLTEAAEYVCTCFEEKIETGEVQNMELALGTCMITFLEKDRERAEVAFGPIEYSDVGTMTRVGEKLGVKMATVCPESLIKIAGKESGEDNGGEISGTLSSLSFNSQIVELTVQEGSGRPVKLYWLSYFSGAELLLEETSIIGKQVTVSYENQDIFSGAAKEYITRRVITELIVE
jgi:hypothetical protein